MPVLERGLDGLGFLPDALRDALRRRLRELVGLTLIVASILLALALATWSVRDPSLSHATNSAVRNVLGPPGAHKLTINDTSGSPVTTSSVSRMWMDSIMATAATASTLVDTVYMRAGPAIIRTAPRSADARDIRSPVRARSKYSRGKRCRCAKKSLRMSYSTVRDAPIINRRIAYRKTPPIAAIASTAAP